MLDYLRSTLKTEYKPGPGSFLEIEAAKLIEKLDLREKGAARGFKGVPAADSQVLDEIEQEIVNTIRSVATEAHGRTHDEISTYAQRLKSADISGASTEMKTLARQSEGDFEAEVLSARGDLEKARKAVMDRRRDVDAFRKKNGLTREVTPSKDAIWMIAALFIMFGIEVVPNASVLMDTDAHGFAGGISQAIIYSALNILVGLVCGFFCWRNVIHRNLGRKFLGFLFALGLAGFIVCLNLALAHYRAGTVLGLPAEEARAYAVTMLTEKPFGITDLKSIGMVAMGVLFSFIAMVEGFVWLDSYPGYHAVSKLLHDAEDRFHNLVDDKIDYLKGVQESFVERITNERRKLRDKRQEIPLVLGERKRLVARFESHIAHLQDVGRAMLATYREENLKARKDSGPTRFRDGAWTLDGFEKIGFDDEVWQTPEKEWTDANEALEVSVDKLQSAYEAALKWIRAQGVEYRHEGEDKSGTEQTA
ncbi:MAG: hypothetical protein HYU58_09040 [Proteobacteria bacterium]|nr:hypothetical protein [Pseudomonadota bacterium]